MLPGVGAGFAMHMMLAAFGLTVFVLAVPAAYAVLKYLGAGYLLWRAGFRGGRSGEGGSAG